MVNLEDVESKLRRLKPDVADRFNEMHQYLATRFSDDALREWSSVCWVLADSGWHGWESANDYIALSRHLSEPDEIIAIGKFCQGFVSTSFEPGRTYLRGVSSLVQAADTCSLEYIQDIGLIVQSRFPLATNLHAACFNAAFQIALAQDEVNLTAWCEFAKRTTAEERAVLLEFLERSIAAPELNWHRLNCIGQLHRQNAMDLLSFQMQLPHASAPIEEPLSKLVEQFSEQGDPVEEWLSILADLLPMQTELESRSLLELAGELPDVGSMIALSRSARQLPLTNPHVVRQWLTQLPTTEKANVKLAYLRLESSNSLQQLERFLGEVFVSDLQRRLQLFVEAMSGTRLKIELGDGLPMSDGLHIRLPEVVRYAANFEDNFNWLKVALSHQLGCYEFGTFEFVRAGTYTAFENSFNQFEQPGLAETLFTICESARIDWRLAGQYRGLSVALSDIKGTALSTRLTSNLSERHQLLEVLVQRSLDEEIENMSFVTNALGNKVQPLVDAIDQLKSPASTVQSSMEVMAVCYSLVVSTAIDVRPISPIHYRGIVAFDDAAIHRQLTALEEDELDFLDGEDDGVQMTGKADEANMDVDELQAGEVDNPSAVISADEDMLVPDDLEQLEDPAGLQKMERLKQQRAEPAETTFRYDEWDYGIEDYRRRWCTLFEFRKLDQDIEFVPNALSEHRSLATKVRRQLNMLRPELLRKVKGVSDGEELDLEKAIEAVVDRKSGVSPSENIYVQRQRKERDVSALFLLDMSASTDDLIEPEEKTPVVVDDDYLHGFSPIDDQPPKERGKTILDLEKESVVLMAEALEGLGDAYAVCGFSGYGRDCVEYYVCKDFDEPYNYHAKANIGGIKPCRSTRMGPAIRHATKMLEATESRIKALIIISDGYPQDFDYGQDRNSKDYGIKDTTKALTEASQKGVQSFCLTVDQSGHDYLREMCPDQQYMVMQDITQLPDELSKVYRGLTS